MFDIVIKNPKITSDGRLVNNPYILDKNEWPYRESIISKFDEQSNIVEWCHSNLKQDEWTYTLMFFAFKTKEAHTWFMLRWS
jgi:hypothetical protein